MYIDLNLGSIILKDNLIELEPCIADNQQVIIQKPL
jgi:hypothetical protein